MAQRTEAGERADSPEYLTEEEVAELTLLELRATCREHGLYTRGGKDEIRARLNSYFLKITPPKGPTVVDEVAEVEKEEETTRPKTRKKYHREKSTSVSDESSEEDERRIRKREKREAEESLLQRKGLHGTTRSWCEALKLLTGVEWSLPSPTFTTERIFLEPYYWLMILDRMLVEDPRIKTTTGLHGQTRFGLSLTHAFHTFTRFDDRAINECLATIDQMIMMLKLSQHESAVGFIQENWTIMQLFKTQHNGRYASLLRRCEPERFRSYMAISKAKLLTLPDDMAAKEKSVGTAERGGHPSRGRSAGPLGGRPRRPPEGPSCDECHKPIGSQTWAEHNQACPAKSKRRRPTEPPKQNQESQKAITPM